MNGTKIAIIVVIIVAIAGAAYIFTRPQTTQTTENPNGTQMTEQGTMESESMENESMTGDQMMEDEQTEQSATGNVIQLTGTNYEFSQETIEVEVGEPVTIELTSGEGMHDWVLDEFNASTERINQGQTTTVTFTPTETGEFEYYCSVGNHRELGMVGTLVVTE